MPDIIPCLFDANSIVKYYTNELGSDIITYLFDKSPTTQINIVNLHIPEVISVFHKIHAKKLISDNDRDIVIDTFLKDISDGKILPYKCDEEYFDKIYSNFYTVFKIPPPPKKMKYFWFKKGYVIELKDIADTNDIAMLTIMQEIQSIVGESYLFTSVTSDGHVLEIAKALGLSVLDPEKMNFNDLPLSLDKRSAKREKISIRAICHDCETSNPLGSKRTVDLSYNGACINLGKIIEKGKSIIVNLIKAGDKAPIYKIKSEVVWATEENIGVRFQEPDSISIFRLQ